MYMLDGVLQFVNPPHSLQGIQIKYITKHNPGNALNAVDLQDVLVIDKLTQAVPAIGYLRMSCTTLGHIFW